MPHLSKVQSQVLRSRFPRGQTGRPEAPSAPVLLDPAQTRVQWAGCFILRTSPQRVTLLVSNVSFIMRRPPTKPRTASVVIVSHHSILPTPSPFDAIYNPSFRLCCLSGWSCLSFNTIQRRRLTFPSNPPNRPIDPLLDTLQIACESVLRNVMRVTVASSLPGEPPLWSDVFRE